jgi:hypothetical protein
MSGYLQRLVDSAAGRAPAVHPRTGSIFSPRVEERHAPLQNWEETEQAATPHLTRDPHAAQPELPSAHTPASLASRSVPPEFEHTPLLPPAPVLPEPHASAPSLLPAVPGSSARANASLDARTLEIASEHARHPFAASTDVHRDATLPAAARTADAFRPLLTPPHTFASVISAAERRERPRPRQAAHAAQPHDDIQIHIGRIEVVAVPPPAQTPRAPKAADSGLSLDAYLNRRNERAR